MVELWDWQFTALIAAGVSIGTLNWHVLTRPEPAKGTDMLALAIAALITVAYPFLIYAYLYAHRSR